MEGGGQTIANLKPSKAIKMCVPGECNRPPLSTRGQMSGRGWWKGEQRVVHLLTKLSQLGGLSISGEMRGFVLEFGTICIAYVELRYNNP